MDNQPPADPYGDVPMDPDVNMPGPPLVPDDDHPEDPDNPPPDDPMPPQDPPPFPSDNTPPPGFDPGTQPPDPPTSSPHTPNPGPYPPGPPHQGSSVPPTPLPHQPTPSFTPPTTTLPLQPLPANAFVPTLVVPPNVADTPMHQSTKREQSVPASSPPKKAKAPAPGNQMIAPSGSSSHNHLGGDVPGSTSSQSSKPKADKPDIEPEDEDETDPQAGPSSGTPILPIDDDDAANVPVPNDDKSDTLEYHSSPEGLTDSDDTVEYQDLVINDDESWSLLTEEQKLCSNTGSFSVPRYIDNSPVDVTGVRSSNSYETSTRTYRGQNNVRKNYSDITEFYDHLTPEDSAYMTLYQSLDKSSLLVGKKRKEAT